MALKILILFFTSLSVGFTGAMSPGAMLTVTINETLRREKNVALRLVTGHALLELILVIALVKGLGTIFRQDVIGGVVGLFGGAFLIWMGFTLGRDAWQGKLTIDADNPKPYNLNLLAAGALVSLANPYWTIWWLLTGAAFLVQGLKYGTAGVAAFYFGHILADYVWYFAVSWAVLKGRQLLKDNVYRWIMIACGGLLLIFGFYFVISGFNFLFF